MDDHRGSGGEPEHGTAGVPPGALSALLGELAHAPSAVPQPEGSWPKPGAVIGRFELVREIGRGGFGVVYEARDQELHRSVAFKLVRPGRLEHGVAQLGREAEVIARLSHPNLVTLFDVGRCAHGPYLVLELLRGWTLERRLREEKVPLGEAVRIAAEIARGLAHAHAEGVVHRDLKPSNVFLCRSGQVKILDFGMSHAFGRRRVEGGTPGYMAPEQWKGAPEDERTDVFALGVMLHRMLAGELPFPSDDGGKSVSSPRRAAELRIPEAPALVALVSRMLEKDPVDRPRDGGVVAASLAALEGDPGATAAVAADPPRRARRRSRRALYLLLAGVAVGAAGAAAWLLTRPPAAMRARSVAVHTFVNMSGVADNDYFSDGLTGEICNLLVRLRELRVSCPPRGGSVEPAPRSIDVVLEGSVRREKDRLRIGAELVNARTGFRHWSQIYDRRLEDVFAIQEDIARQVVSALALVLSRASEGALLRTATPSLPAYDLYLRARAALRRPRSAASLSQATDLFEQALAADAQFDQAQAGLCDAWLARYELTRAAESFERAEKACQEALARGRDTGELHVALGNLHLLAGRLEEAEKDLLRARSLSYDPVDALLGLARVAEAQKRLDVAERTFDEARRLDPGDTRVYRLLGNFLFHQGRHAEAARAYADEIARTTDNASAYAALGAAHYMAGDFEKAAEARQTSLSLAPTRAGYSNAGSSLYYLARFDEAASMYRKALELAPDDYQMWGNLGDALSHAAGKQGEAAAAYRRAVDLGEAALHINPSDADTLSDLALYHAALGHPDRARKLDEEARARDPGNMYVHYNAALVAVRLSSTEAALAELERAVALGYQRQLLPADAGLEPLRSHPRFAALVGPRKPAAAAAPPEREKR